MAKKYSLYDGSQLAGSVEVDGDTVKITGVKNAQVKMNYVQSIDIDGAKPLGKIGVALAYFDMFGNKETLHTAMNDSDARALKQLLGK